MDHAAFDAFEAEGWGLKAPTYELLTGRVTRRLVEPLLDAAGVGPGSRLLDIGTGPGHIAGRALERGAVPVGVDVAEAMLERAREHYPGIEFRLGDAHELPFADESFDAGVVGFVLLHLSRPDLAASELVRVLVPGGKAAFAMWDVPARTRLVGILLDAIEEVEVSPPPTLPPGPPIFLFADEIELTRLLEDAGLGNVEIEDVEFAEPVRSADELWHGLLGATVRIPPVVLAQSAEVQGRIRAAFDARLEEHRVGDGFEVPVAVKLASGRKEA